MTYLRNRLFIRIRVIFFIISSITPCNVVFSQCITSAEVWNKIVATEKDEASPIAEKLQKLNDLQKELLRCKYPEDSVYARLLHRIAALEYLSNNYMATPKAIQDVLESIRINNSGQKNACPQYLVNSYYNLATFYQTLNQNHKALSLYDSVIVIKMKNRIVDQYTINSRIFRSDIFFKFGDFQKCIDEASFAIAEAESISKFESVMTAFNRRAQSYAYLGNQEKAFNDADSALKYAKNFNTDFEKATSLKIIAQLYASTGVFEKASDFFKRSIQIRLKTNEYEQIADDYTDLGNYYLQKLKEYNKAEHCYMQTIAYAHKSDNAERLCKAYINLGELEFQRKQQNNYIKSVQYYTKALNVYGIREEGFLKNQSLTGLSSIGNIDLLLVLLGNRTEWLLSMYKQNKNKVYIDACLKSAIIMDSAITQARRQQVGEQSKLYWRNSTRSFFANAIEACYLADNDSLAFYFMEKSRSVLLSDKLNELNAQVHLPEAEAATEQDFISRLVSGRLKLNSLDIHSEKFRVQQIELLKIKADFENFVKSLDQKYPLYYQYKYADEVQNISVLQDWLKNTESYFVHYFIQDTEAYILAIGPHESHMMKLNEDSFNTVEIDEFLKYCSNKQMLNNDYADFSKLSNTLYHTLFAGLNIPYGRVILCLDNFLIPFEALATDKKGKNFLINHYTFSYTYSARYLLRNPETNPASGSFIGFAPVSFNTGLQVPDLKNAARALKKAASDYDDAVLFTHKEASKSNFLKKIANYSIVNVFSHALADTTSQDPVLYMQDSAINIQELQLIGQNATQLVMLSACQTNVGRNATGEGIYSLARGFAAVGIPAVSATLWKADEETIYKIAQKMNEYLAAGMRKDEALKKAKLFLMQNGGKEKQLPYFWANIILVGNGFPVNFTNQSTHYIMWLWITVLTVTLTAGIIILYRYRTKSYI